MIWPLVVAGACLVGMVGGAGLAWLLRRYTDVDARNLYIVAGILLAVEVALWAARLTTIAAAILPGTLLWVAAAAMGRRWRLSDLGAGEDLRDYENARRWIWQPKRTLLEGESVKLGGQGQVIRKFEWPASEPYVPMTADPDGPRVPRGDGHHLFSVGGTGSGKTTSVLRALAGRVIKTGGAGLVLDQKGDAPTETFLRALAAATGRPFVIFDPRDPDSDRWQPIWGDHPNEVAARLVAGIQTTEPYYADSLRNHLILVLEVLHAAGQWPPGFRDIVKQTRLSNFKSIVDLAQTIPVDGPLDEEDRRELIADVKDHWSFCKSMPGQNALNGGLTRLALVGKAWTKVLRPRDLPDGRRAGITLPQALDAGAIVLWRTWVDVMPEAAEAMTALALSDIHAAASVAGTDDERSGRPPAPPWTALVDEFAGVLESAGPLVLALLQRGRSHHGQILVVTQSVADVEAITGKTGLLESLTDNFAGIIAHRQQAPDSRDWLARLFGTISLWSSTDQTTGYGQIASGDGSRRRVRQFVVAADTFADLPKFWAVIGSFSPRALPVKTKVDQLHLPPGDPIRTGGDTPTACETVIFTKPARGAGFDDEDESEDEAPEVPVARAITPARPRRSLRRPAPRQEEDQEAAPALDELEPPNPTSDIINRPPEPVEPPDIDEPTDDQPEQREGERPPRRKRKGKRSTGRPANNLEDERQRGPQTGTEPADDGDEGEWRPGAALDF